MIKSRTQIVIGPSASGRTVALGTTTCKAQANKRAEVPAPKKGWRRWF